MKTHLKQGGQLNETLVNRSIVDWCYPLPIQCESTLKTLAQIYVDGHPEYDVQKHRAPLFLDDRKRHRNYDKGSKVLSRLGEKEIKNPFIFN